MCRYKQHSTNKCIVKVLVAWMDMVSNDNKQILQYVNKLQWRIWIGGGGGGTLNAAPS